MTGTPPAIGKRLARRSSGPHGPADCRQRTEVSCFITFVLWFGETSGMTTAEYAVGTVAACGFGGLLLQLLTSDSVLSLLRDVIRNAFSAFL